MNRNNLQTQTPTVTPTIALCYVRVSVGSSDNDQSPERQRANMVRLCEKHGFTPEFHEDIRGHNSGLSNRRKALQALEARISDPTVAALVVNEQARATRSVETIRRLLRLLQQHNKRLFYASEDREVNINDGREIMHITLKAIMDEEYVRFCADRSRDSIRYRKAQGKSIAIPPFGTVRNQDGFLELTKGGAWRLPDGQYVPGDDSTPPPHDDAVWYGYADCAEKILRLYAQNQHGYNRLAHIMTEEGYRFRDRYNEPRLINSDDIRRVTSNWRTYAGNVVYGRGKEIIAHRTEKPSEIPYDAQRAVFPLDLIRAVAEAQEKRSITTRPTGSVRRAHGYVLTRIVFCAHCERLAEQEGNPQRRSRLSGTNQQGKLRYRHQEGLRCGCQRRSVSLSAIEDDFRRLINLLTLNEETENVLFQYHIEQQKKESKDEQKEIESRRKREIAKLRGGIDSAQKMALSGDITFEEYAALKQEKERAIVHWESHTSTAEEKVLELNACIEALRRIQGLWEEATPEQRQVLARGLFEYIVYDLDQQRITSFRLHGWADHYLELCEQLYSDGEFVRGGAFDDPNGTRTRVFTLKG